MMFSWNTGAAATTQAVPASKPLASGPLVSGPLTTASFSSRPMGSAPLASRPVASGPLVSGSVASGPLSSTYYTSSVRAAATGSSYTIAPIGTAPVLAKSLATQPTLMDLTQATGKVSVGSFVVGDAVEYLSASVGKWIPAKILKANANGTYDLDCKPDVSADRIRSPLVGQSARQGAVGFIAGDIVEYYSTSQGRWIMAKVLKARDDGTFDLDCKPEVLASSIRATHQAGDAVEYHSASHSKWIPAKVLKVNPRGTFDLDCKPDVTLDKIRRPGQSTSATYRPGDAVEYLSTTVNRWILAKVVSANSTGTYDLDCKPDVPAERIRSPQGGESIAKNLDAAVGDTVEYFSATHNRWIPAKVLAINAYGTFDLDCKPDVQADKIRAAASGAAAAPVREEQQPGRFHVGEEVEYFGATQKRWVATKVVKVNGDGTYDLDCKPGVTSEKIRRTQRGASACAPPSGRGEAAGATPASPSSSAHRVGDVVEYFGATLQRWIPARVLAVKPGGLYDLDCKQAAPADKVRRPQTAAAEEACDQTPHTPARTGNGRWVPAPGLGKPVQLLSARRVGGGLLGGGGSWRFELCPEGAAALERLGGRRVAVVSVCGPRRSGKTSLVDGLRGGEKSGASAGTGGLWLSASVEEDDEGGPVLAYWDCEGFGGSSGDQGRDAHVLALLALLSSALLVNTTGGALDDAALAGLAGACRFGESIEERGNESSRPLLLWVLRDVARQLQDSKGRILAPEEYLESCLHAEPQSDEHARAANDVRRSMLHFFKHRGCVALPPVANKSGHKASVLSLREQVVSMCLSNPKMVGGQPLTCYSLVQMLRQLASAATDGRILNIKAAWETVQHTTCGSLADELREDASRLLRDLASGRPVPGGAKLPLTDAELDGVLRGRRHALKDQWEERAVGDEHVRREYWQELKEALAREEGLVRAHNAKLADQQGMDALRAWQEWLDAEGDGAASAAGAEGVCRRLGGSMERMPARALSRVGRAALQAATRRVAVARDIVRRTAERHSDLRQRAVAHGERAAHQEGATRSELEAKKAELADAQTSVEAKDSEHRRLGQELVARSQEVDEAEGQLKAALLELEAVRAREREQAARHRAQVNTLDSLQNELEQVRASAARDDATRLSADRLKEAAAENAAAERRRLEEEIATARADARRSAELLAEEKARHEDKLEEVRVVHHKQVETAKRQLVQERESLQVRHAELKETHQKKVEDAHREVEEQRKTHSGAIDDHRRRLLERERRNGVLEGKLGALGSEAEVLRSRLKELEEQVHQAEVLAEQRQYDNRQLERELGDARAEGERVRADADERSERIAREVEMAKQESLDRKVQAKGCGISLRRMLPSRRAAEAGA